MMVPILTSSRTSSSVSCRQGFAPGVCRVVPSSFGSCLVPGPSVSSGMGTSHSVNTGGASWSCSSRGPFPGWLWSSPLLSPEGDFAVDLDSDLRCRPLSLLLDLDVLPLGRSRPWGLCSSLRFGIYRSLPVFLRYTSSFRPSWYLPSFPLPSELLPCCWFRPRSAPLSGCWFEELLPAGRLYVTRIPLPPVRAFSPAVGMV
jgi:hypothetical protein